MQYREWTPLGLPHYQDPHYRSYGAQWMVDRTGELVVYQAYEICTDGDWEGFVVELDRRPAPSRN